MLLWLLALLMLTVGCGQPSSPSSDQPASPGSDQQRAEAVARQFVVEKTPPGYVDRATVEVRPSAAGWMVVFHDVNVPCDQARWGPDLCGIPAAGVSTPIPSVFRDVFVCVTPDLSHVASVGGAPTPLDQTDRCPPP